MHVHRTLPSSRALLLAALPGVVVGFVFGAWLGFSAGVALLAALGWFVAALVVTRLLYDDAVAETAAWRQAAPDLATPPLPGEPRAAQAIPADAGSDAGASVGEVAAGLDPGDG